MGHHGHVRVNGEIVSPNFQLQPGDFVTVSEAVSQVIRTPRETWENKLWFSQKKVPPPGFRMPSGGKDRKGKENWWDKKVRRLFWTTPKQVMGPYWVRDFKTDAVLFSKQPTFAETQKSKKTTLGFANCSYETAREAYR